MTTKHIIIRKLDTGWTSDIGIPNPHANRFDSHYDALDAIKTLQTSGLRGPYLIVTEDNLHHWV